MKTVSPPYEETWALPRTRFADYAELTKPRIAVLVLFTVAIGGLIALRDVADLPLIVHAIIGAALVASAASALNQFWERHTDALMRRTENRPLPAGRLSALEVFVFGVGLAAIGLCYQALTLPTPWCVLVTAGTFLSYVFVYTPLKRVTTLNTLIGAVPGALPPVIGWAAVAGGFDLSILTLFLVLLFWQIPHFLAIAWMYREDYGRAGLRMLPVTDATGTVTAQRMVFFTMLLMGSSLIPVIGGAAGWCYAVAALVLGALFLAAIVGFAQAPSIMRARRVLHMSLLYLPALCLVLLLENLL